jgi:hypothetical protein
MKHIEKCYILFIFSTKTGFFGQVLMKLSKTNLQENSFSGDRDVCSDMRGARGT